VNADAVSRLCLRCGLCCDGSIFTHIAPRGDELAMLAAQGTKIHVITRRDGSCVIGLPCPALEGTRCSAYEGRPQGCRDFVCATASQLADDRLSEAEAAAVVDEATRRIAAVAEALPDDARQLTKWPGASARR
jgi:uncharacterized protein